MKTAILKTKSGERTDRAVCAQDSSELRLTRHSHGCHESRTKLRCHATGERASKWQEMRGGKMAGQTG
jgi:hypothetical protein